MALSADRDEEPIDPSTPWRTGLAVILLVACASVLVVVLMVVTARDDTPLEADAVVVLGGYGPERTDLGIELAERFDAVLVLSSSAAHFGAERGYTCGDEAICLEPEPETTTGEAQDVAALAEARGWAHVTVVTSSHHTTRARVLFRQCLGGDVSVVGAPRRDGGPELAGYVREVAGTLAAFSIRRACW